MKKNIIYMFLLIMCGFLFIPFVYAEDDVETSSTCDPIALKDYIKEAEKVTGTYEFVYDISNKVIGFNYLIYNIPDNMYVTYKGLPSQKDDTFEDVDVLDVDRSIGMGKLFDPNIDDIYTVTFNVFLSTGSCNTSLNSIKIKKLRYNPISEVEQCKYDGLEDFLYCKPWVEVVFPFGQDEIIKKIESKKDQLKEKTTSVCLSCIENEKNEEKYNTMLLIKNIVIFGLISGIIIDIVIIIYLFRKVGESKI